MKSKRYLLRTLMLSLGTVPLAAAETAVEPVAQSWHAQTLSGALLHMALFSAIGIVAAILGYIAFDKCTPGDLHKEIVENRNTAAALIGSAVILGVCIIVAAAMVG
jgi:uncharacterized membrane protein YjfL (UPF0719 family)